LDLVTAVAPLVLTKDDEKPVLALVPAENYIRQY
jgi:hypothetical protein